MRGYDQHKAIWDETPSGKMLEHVDKSLTLAIMEHTHIIYLYIYIHLNSQFTISYLGIPLQKKTLYMEIPAE